MSLEGILDHLQTFLQQLPALISSSDELGNQVLAQQFSVQSLAVTQAAELLWHAQLAGHPSTYLDELEQLIQTRTHADIQRAAQQLNDATGGWQCVANGPRVNDSWQSGS